MSRLRIPGCMTLEPSGVAGSVSDYITSDRIVDKRVTDRPHVCVYRIPKDDEGLIEDGSAHDVVIRAPEDEQGNREVVESLGSFPKVDEACVRAAELSKARDALLWDDIVELR